MELKFSTFWSYLLVLFSTYAEQQSVTDSKCYKSALLAFVLKHKWQSKDRYYLIVQLNLKLSKTIN